MNSQLNFGVLKDALWWVVHPQQKRPDTSPHRDGIMRHKGLKRGCGIFDDQVNEKNSAALNAIH